MQNLPNGLDEFWSVVFEAMRQEGHEAPFHPTIVSWGRMGKKFYRRAGMCIKILQARPDATGIWKYVHVQDIGKVIWGTAKAAERARHYASVNGLPYIGRVKPGKVVWNSRIR